MIETLVKLTEILFTALWSLLARQKFIYLSIRTSNYSLYQVRIKGLNSASAFAGMT